MRFGFLISLALLGARAVAQSTALPPIRDLGPPIAAVRDAFGNVQDVRGLSDGRVLVNDNTKRRIVLLDKTLANPIIVADSTVSTNRAYGAGYTVIRPYRGDSSLVIDAASTAMLVVDPSGGISRTISPPVPNEVGALVGIVTKGAQFDGHESVVYRPGKYAVTMLSGSRFSISLPFAPTVTAAALVLSNVPIYAMHDSAPVVRANIPSHRVDTVGYFAIPLASGLVCDSNCEDRGRGSMHAVALTPFQFDDDWVAMPDGSVAFIRGLDFHIDWVALDGSRRSTPPVLTQYQQLTLDDKVRLIDSLKRRQDSIDAVSVAMQARQDSARRASGRGAAPPRTPGTVRYPEPDDLPSHLPPFVLEASRADADANIWIMTSRTHDSAGVHLGSVYDIVGSDGKLKDRLRLPPSFALVGFSPGVVYLAGREGTGVTLAKYGIR